MKGLTLCSVVLLSGSLLFSSCGTWTNTAKGTAIGVGGGAAVGAGIGALAGNTALGTAIGAALGGTAGALIGKKMDKQKKELEATLPEETTIETINEGEALRVTFDSGILFATNSSTLSDASRSAAQRPPEVSRKPQPESGYGHQDRRPYRQYRQRGLQPDPLRKARQERLRLPDGGPRRQQQAHGVRGQRYPRAYRR